MQTAGARVGPIDLPAIADDRSSSRATAAAQRDWQYAARKGLLISTASASLPSNKTLSVSRLFLLNGFCLQAIFTRYTALNMR